MQRSALTNPRLIDAPRASRGPDPIAIWRLDCEERCSQEVQYRQAYLPFVSKLQHQRSTAAVRARIDCLETACLETDSDRVSTEALVRDRLHSELITSVGHDCATVFEMWIPRSNERVDMAVISLDLAGYEIKTERDTLKRLPRQAAAYARVFDRCTTVLAARHVSGAIDLLPEWWGVTAIVQVDGSPAFRSIRAPGNNPGIDLETVVRLLWREEAQRVLAAAGEKIDADASRESMWYRLLDVLDTCQLKEAVRKVLLTRDPKRARIPTRRFGLRSVSLTVHGLSYEAKVV